MKLDDRSAPSRSGAPITITTTASAASSDLVREYGFDSVEAGEVAVVESQDFCDAMGFHHGGEPRVVNFHPAHPARSDQRFPGRVGSRILTDYLEKSLKLGQFRLGFLNREAKAIVLRGPSRDIPEFSYVLNRDGRDSSLSMRIFSARAAASFMGWVGCAARSRMFVSTR
jgi:hypothetical protein